MRHADSARARAIAVAAAALTVFGCGDDETTSPDDPTPTAVRFPEQVADLGMAVAQAGANGVVSAAVGLHVVDAPVVIEAEQRGVTIMGREPSTRDAARGGTTRATLSFDLGSTTDAILVNARDVTIQDVVIEGTYRSGVVIRASGVSVLDCRVNGAARYAISCPTPESDAVIQRNVLVAPGIFGVHCTMGAAPIVERNTIARSGDCGIFTSGSAPIVSQNAIVQSANFGIACFETPVPTLGCNLLFESATADYSESCVPGDTDLHEDPLFCDDETFMLLPDSPCVPGGKATCDGIGAILEICPVRAPAGVGSPHGS